MTFFKKKIFIIILSVALLSLYLYAALLPGVWHRDTFLYLRDDGSFSGESSFFAYEMDITQNDNGTDISFRVNDIVRNYRIVSEIESHSVEIFENENSVFKGTVARSGDSSLLLDDNEGFIDFSVTVTTGDDFFTVPDETEQFPTYTALYNYSVKNDTDTRGNLIMAFFAVLIAVFLAIDIRYPDLFFYLKYMWHVDGGSPSEFYRFGQKVSHVISIIVIVGFLIATFFIH